MGLDAWFSGAGVAIIVFVFGLIKFFITLVPHPVFKLIDEERAFLNNNIKILRSFVFEIFYFVIISLFALSITNIPFDGIQLINKFPFISPTKYPLYFYYTGVSIFVIIFLILLLISQIAPIRTLFFSYMKEKIISKSLLSKMSFIGIFLFVVYVYLLIPLYSFGYITHLLLFAIGFDLKLNVISSTEVLLYIPSKTSTLVSVVFGITYMLMYFLYRWIIGHILIIGKLMSNTKVLTTIVLSDGTTLVDQYILRPSIDGNILIGNESTIHESDEKIMLPKQSILYIKLRKVAYVFGQEIKTESLNDDVLSIEGALMPRKRRHGI